MFIGYEEDAVEFKDCDINFDTEFDALSIPIVTVYDDRGGRLKLYFERTHTVEGAREALTQARFIREALEEAEEYLAANLEVLYDREGPELTFEEKSQALVDSIHDLVGVGA